MFGTKTSIYEQSLRNLNDSLRKDLRGYILSRTFPDKDGTLFYVQWAYDPSMDSLGTFQTLARAFTKGKSKLIRPYKGKLPMTLSSPCKYQWSDDTGNVLTYGLNLTDHIIYLQVTNNA